MISNIFDYIKTEEANYKSTPIPVADGFEWHMPEHIRACTLYKDGKRLNSNNEDEPVKNIILPILNVNYRIEGFDVKDIFLYVDSPDCYFKSFLLRKFHETWAREQGIDTFIDEIVESYVDYGGVIVKNVKGARPEVIPLQKIAFCDQTDFLSGPFCIKHQFSIDQLKEKSNIWNKESIDEIVSQSRAEKSVSQSNDKMAKTTGKYIEVYEVHGSFPKDWITKDTEFYQEFDEDEYANQIHIVSFVTDRDVGKRGITLYKGPEKKGNFKILKRDKRFGTALGRSAIEELIEPQVWTNYSMIQIKQMLDKAALMLGVTDDPQFTSKNRMVDLEKGEWLVKGQNTTVEPFAFPLSNLNAFENSIASWEQHARMTGSASDPALGVDPVSGTPLGTTQLVTQQGQGMHEYRRGQIATFVEEIYREWILPKMINEISNGKVFMSELSLEELQEVTEAITNHHVNNVIKDRILSGKLVFREQVDAFKSLISDEFIKGGNKRFLEILKDEMTDKPINVLVNVAGKQKNLNQVVDKLSNIFRAVFANPQILQDPNAAKIFNDIYEFSGFSPLSIKKVELPVTGEMMSPMQPMQNNNVVV